MTLVVIGGVAAGLSAAARARRLDPRAEIIVLEKGRTISYGACGLPYFIEGRVRSPEELVVYTPGKFAAERNVDVRTDAEVTAIRHARREVLVKGGGAVRFDKLIVATGAAPDRAALANCDERVFTLHTLEDGKRLRYHLDAARPRTAAIIGGGYIGLEVAEALRTQGLEVTLIEAGTDLLGRSAELSARLKQHLERFRIEVQLGRRVHDAAALEADIVVLAAGLKPNVRVAAEAGIELGRTGAIRVTDRMETNLTGVYAAGDCAETTHLVTGQPVWVPLGTTANKLGRVAGASAAGARERFPGILGTSIVRVCGLAVASTGLTAAEAKQAGFDAVAARIDAKDKPRYFQGEPVTVELVAERRTGRLLGGTVMGGQSAAGRINTLAAAIRYRATVEDLEMLDLAYAPPYAPVWDPLLVTAQQLRREVS